MEVVRITPKELMKAICKLNAAFPGVMGIEDDHYKLHYLTKLADDCYECFIRADHFTDIARNFEVISRDQAAFLSHLMKNTEAFHYWLYSK